MGFQLVEHTADVGLRVWGRSLEELFESAAKGMFSIIGAPEEHGVERSIFLTADDLETLLVDWLSHLLFLHETRQETYDRFEVSIRPCWTLRGAALGGPAGVHGSEVKAVTYHGLKIDREGDLYTATIVFDV